MPKQDGSRFCYHWVRVDLFVFGSLFSRVERFFAKIVFEYNIMKEIRVDEILNRDY